MNRVGTALLMVLLVQLVLVFSLYRAPSGDASAGAQQPLTKAAYFHIDEIHIEDGHGNKVHLEHRGERWVLPALGHLPAQQSRVDLLLAPLAEENTGWAVAHTLPARQRFQVAHYHFRRKITLLAQDEPIDTVFLGTSPGFRKVHARNDVDNAIYSISLNLVDLPTEQGRWLAEDILKVRAPLRIAADTYVVDRSSGEWQLGTGEQPDAAELEALLQNLEQLQIEGVAEPRPLDEAELILEIEGLAGTTTLAFYREGEEHFIRSSDHPLLFRLSRYTFDQLTGIALSM